jgi:hypothetical protein
MQRALFDQYFLKNHAQYEKCINQVQHHFTDETVIEFGIGHGEISFLTLQMGVEKIVGFEIDQSLNIPHHPAMTVIKDDFNTYLHQPIIETPHWIVANPPYIHLENISFYTKFPQVKGYLLIMSDWRQKEYFPEAQILGEIEKEDFSPVPIGRHLVVFYRKT